MTDAAQARAGSSDQGSVVDRRDRVMEFYDRALSGRAIEEKQFDSRVLPRSIRELVRKYEIKMRPDDVVLADVDMARRIFEAGIDLLAKVGIYCQDTGRIIEVSRDEIEGCLAEATSSFSVGCGDQVHEVRARSLEDTRLPTIGNGSQGTALSEEAIVPALTSVALEDIDVLTSGCLTTVLGRQNLARTPAEVMACKKEAIWARRSLEIAGKPGLAILGIMSGANSESQATCVFADGLRPTDRHLIIVGNELKVDYQALNKVIHDHYAGIGIVGTPTPTFGGYCGGAEGTAICGVAEALLSLLVFGAQSVTWYAQSLWTSVTSGRESVWAEAAMSLAFVAAGHDVPTGHWLSGMAGPMTEMLCQEIAAQAVAVTASGASDYMGIVGNGGAARDHVTGMDTRMLVEVTQASAGMSLSEANEIVRGILALYEDKLSEELAPYGKSFFECYDADTLQPKDEYLALWEAQKDVLGSCGLPI